MVQNNSPETVGSADSAAYDDLIGNTVANNFYLVRRIGSGGMGRVYEAEQLSLGKRVAIKVLRREFMGDERALTRFELEARAASALNHPNLVQIFDCGRDTALDVVYIAMELLPGIDLHQMIERESPVPLHRTAYIIDDVLAALDEAHAQGVIHRDLKPANIMLVPRRNQTDLVKVLDFGIAKAPPRYKHNATLAGFVFGTPEYMSPEQARGVNVDCRTDLYSVAAILYQLLVGEAPFQSPSASEVLARLLRDEPQRPSARANVYLPDALEDLVMRGLAKRPEDRPQTAAQFRDELRTALAGVITSWPGQTGSMPAAGPITAVTARPPTAQGAAAPTPRAAAPAAAAAGEPRYFDVSDAGPTHEVPSLRPKSRLWMLLAAVALIAGSGGAVLVARPEWRPGARTAAPAPAPVAAAVPAGQGRVAKAEPPPAAAPDNEVVAAAPESPAAEEPDTAPTGAEPPATAGGSRPAKKGALKGRPSQSARRGAAPERRPVAGGRPEEETDRSSAPEAPPAAVTPPPLPVPASEPHPGAGEASDDPMKEAARLLGQGEVAQACRKGEEARRATPRLPAIYKFLGKCYMRAGNTNLAADNYRRYLELAPDAPDAAFIRSYVK